MKTQPTLFRHPAPAALLLAAAALGGCVTTGPVNEGPKSTGAAGGATSVGADASLKTCPEPVGTVRLFDGMTQAVDPRTAAANAQATEPVAQNTIAVLNALAALRPPRQDNSRPSAQDANVSMESLRLLIQQSNCFLIVDRGAAEMAANDEKARTRTSGEVRDGANMGPGQEVAADFVIRSMVLRFENTGSSGASGGGFLPGMLGGLGINKSTNEAQVQLVVSDLRSKIQVAVAQGEASASNTSLAMNIFGKAGRGIGGGGAKTESKTSGQTILMQAFADAYNKLVPALTGYKTQMVRGGAGTGGTLKVQGSQTAPLAADDRP